MDRHLFARVEREVDDHAADGQRTAKPVTTLPTGTVTFLFTDLEGSTRLWEEHPEAMRAALARHDEILRDTVEGHGGHVVKTTGDGLHAAFVTAHDAVGAASGAQAALTAEEWPVPERLRVRIAVHTGEAEVRDGDYYGSAVNRAARLAAAAHGGQVLVSLATEELVRDALGEGVDLIDLGEHRLRDLARPEHVFQLVAPGLGREFGRVRSLDVFAGNLPPQMTSFVGREDELHALGEALRATRLVTLTGVGGVGKTRLATQVAAEVLPWYPHGSWLCELAAATDPDTLLQVVAATLGVNARPGMTLAESIPDFLRTKRLLIVLDNCEHLMDAAGRLAESVLHECPDVRILATSREGLAVAGEHVWPLRSLALPDPAADAAAIVGSDAVQLFADRARAARAGFALDDAHAGAVGEICRRLDGIPLAIELAAARVASMTPAEIAGLLDERFRLLTGGRRSAVERHQTLRATVDWSYSLLTPTERLVFDRLAVFAGGFDADGATAVLSGDGIERWDVVDSLASLVGKSMVVADETADATSRYLLLETLRQYASEQLEEEDGAADAWRRRHAEHFATFAEAAGPQLRGPDELAWHRRVHAELDNLRTALTWSLDSQAGTDSELAIRILAALAYLAGNDQTTGLGAWAERAVGRAESSTPARRAAVLAAAAYAAIVRGDYEVCRSLGLAALRDDAPGPESARALAYLDVALADMVTGQIDQALRVLDDGLLELDDDRFGEILLRQAAAHVEALRLDDAAAGARAEEAVRLARELGNPTQLALALHAQARAITNVDPTAALTALDESIALTRDGAGASVFGMTLGRAAQLRAHFGDPDGALALLREAVAYSHDVGDHMVLSGMLFLGIDALATLGHAEPAAVLAGVVSGSPLSLLSEMPPVPLEQPLEQARTELGSQAFDTAFARGATMEYDEVVAYTLGELDRILAEFDAA
ncbi:MAG: adenylate/guanylate cyclase domain-containing protein [Acidimicrobiia bacterium]|nr:adenylate/guanylate cyclase domain-containing protein [Acidimicrobiia bacterium]